jgi:hypothetical protein
MPFAGTVTPGGKDGERDHVNGGPDNDVSHTDFGKDDVLGVEINR